jgi:hypothetical protein
VRERNEDAANADARVLALATTKVCTMKIVVIGGTGLIGSKLVDKLRDHGHQAVPASQTRV